MLARFEISFLFSVDQLQAISSEVGIQEGLTDADGPPFKVSRENFDEDDDENKYQDLVKFEEYVIYCMLVLLLAFTWTSEAFRKGGGDVNMRGYTVELQILTTANFDEFVPK